MLSDTCVIRFAVLSKIDFHAVLTVFLQVLHYVVWHLSIPTQKFSPTAWWIRQVLLYIWCYNQRNLLGVLHESDDSIFFQAPSLNRTLPALTSNAKVIDSLSATHPPKPSEQGSRTLPAITKLGSTQAFSARSVGSELICQLSIYCLICGNLKPWSCVYEPLTIRCT